MRANVSDADLAEITRTAVAEAKRGGNVGAKSRLWRAGKSWLVVCETPLILERVARTTDRVERARAVRRLNDEGMREYRRERATREGDTRARESGRRTR